MSTTLHINGQAVTLEEVARKSGEISFKLNGKSYRFLGQRTEGGFLLDEEVAPGTWRRISGGIAPSGKGTSQVQLGALEAKVSQIMPGAAAESAGGALSPTAPMPGLVRQVLVKKGDKVSSGQALVILEAMKLQLTLAAGGDGVVEAVLVKAGDMVTEGAELVRVAAKGK